MRWPLLLWLLAALACRSPAPNIDAERTRPPFNRTETKRALNEAAEHAASCGQPAGPRGEGQVECLFAPNGSVRSVRFLAGAFEGTDAGRCVESWFLKVTVPAYRGGTVFVTKKFEVR
jgi:hypothetical protein